MFMLKTHPFNMTFEEIKKTRFKQMLILIDQLQKSRQEKSDQVNSVLKRSKEVMPTYDVAAGIYGQ